MSKRKQTTKPKPEHSQLVALSMVMDSLENYGDRLYEVMCKVSDVKYLLEGFRDRINMDDLDSVAYSSLRISIDYLSDREEELTSMIGHVRHAGIGTKKERWERFRQHYSQERTEKAD